MATATEIRRGMALRYNNDIAIVLDFTHRTPGNKRGFVQATLRSLRTGKSLDARFSTSENIDIVPVMTKKLEYSYKDGADYVFSDTDTYETFTLNPDVVGDAIDFMPENTMVDVVFVEDRAVQIELPSSVVLTVTDSPEGVKGDSTTNVMKTVTVETGINIQAPLFIKQGERIKVDVKSRKYMERVNG